MSLLLTGTFFWDNTTAQSLPLTPIDMILAAVIALKAYSILAVATHQQCGPNATLNLSQEVLSAGIARVDETRESMRTDLV